MSFPPDVLGQLSNAISARAEAAKNAVVAVRLGEGRAGVPRLGVGLGEDTSTGRRFVGCSLVEEVTSATLENGLSQTVDFLLKFIVLIFGRRELFLINLDLMITGCYLTLECGNVLCKRLLRMSVMSQETFQATGRHPTFSADSEVAGRDLIPQLAFLLAGHLLVFFKSGAPVVIDGISGADGALELSRGR